MLRIVSKYSGPGGSTIAFINLCNLFNQHGIDCIFYGPDPWHLDQCRSKDIEEFFVERGDSLIVHLLDSKSPDHLEAKCRSWHLSKYKKKIARLVSLPRQFISQLKSSKIHSCIFSCHEKEVFPFVLLFAPLRKTKLKLMFQKYVSFYVHLFVMLFR